ncbi:hypothetical protein GCM10008090_08850 [Arenicella chitinivorans]|uniref:MFS transporter n=2 Tax=Arenicella chitinivorans TaxID=1329800 RepID=A0A918RM68_9GAMM|nr:hypothetical protein GCM10008090_08850 [Arenicella chitinivorans]
MRSSACSQARCWYSSALSQAYLLATLSINTFGARLIALGFLVWRLDTAVTAAARRFFHVASARVAVYVGKVTLTPSAMSLMSELFPARRRDLFSGLYDLGSPMSAGASLVVAGTLAQSQIGGDAFYY